MTDRETLTDEEREAWSWLASETKAKALRIIDAHEADRAALVKERDEARRKVLLQADAPALVAEVARLTQERDDWKKTAQAGCARCEEREPDVARLTEALAAAERSNAALQANLAAIDHVRVVTEQRLAAAERERDAQWERAEHWEQRHGMQRTRAEAAEQKLAAAEHELDGCSHVLPAECLKRTLAAEARCRELNESLAQADCINGREIKARAAAESELAQLREWVAGLDFKREWAKKKAQGYQYGRDALEGVKFGFEIALEALRGPK